MCTCEARDNRRGHHGVEESRARRKVGDDPARWHVRVVGSNLGHGDVHATSGSRVHVRWQAFVEKGSHR
eukprot:7377160-Prymnesium_polylepis.1